VWNFRELGSESDQTLANRSSFANFDCRHQITTFKLTGAIFRDNLALQTRRPYPQNQSIKRTLALGIRFDRCYTLLWFWCPSSAGLQQLCPAQNWAKGERNQEEYSQEFVFKIAVHAVWRHFLSKGILFLLEMSSRSCLRLIPIQ